ncbi:hypothetical protein OG873_27395 [Streptomyces violaceus]|uniref:Uncharacterized protein n=1 Tax=Streptomyces violaceus TaxID=1936 RepID=A0ABZ1NYW7_STRVL
MSMRSPGPASSRRSPSSFQPVRVCTPFTIPSRWVSAVARWEVEVVFGVVE